MKGIDTREVKEFLLSLIEDSDYIIDSNIAMWGGEIFACRAIAFGKRI